MAACVLDSSVALSWFLPGETTSRTDALLNRVALEGAVAPGLWPLEISNVLLIAERKGRISQAQRVRALTALEQLPVDIDPVTASRAWGRLFDLAQMHGLTTYDAAYLELALRTGQSLATLDGALSRAALAVGVPMALTS